MSLIERPSKLGYSQPARLKGGFRQAVPFCRLQSRLCVPKRAGALLAWGHWHREHGGKEGEAAPLNPAKGTLRGH